MRETECDIINISSGIKCVPERHARIKTNRKSKSKYCMPFNFSQFLRPPPGTRCHPPAPSQTPGKVYTIEHDEAETVT